jgi:hypothetical protein
MEKFRTGRLLARSWQIEYLPLAMQLWGDPAVTALIDSRGKLTEAQVHEKLYARDRAREIQWCSVLGAVRSPQWRLRRLRRTSTLGQYTQRGGFRSGVPSREALLGHRVRNGSCSRRARICVGKIAAVESVCRASPRQSCFGENRKEARIRVHRKCFLRAHRLDASVLRLHGANTQTKHFHIDVDRSS